MTSSERLSALIGSIYDTAVDRADWSEVLAEFGRILESPKSALVSINESSLDATVRLNPGFDPAEVERYERDYAQANPMIVDASRRPYGSLRADTLLPDYDAYRQSAVYNEIFEPNAAQHIIGCFLVRDGGSGLAIALHRGREAGPHSHPEHRLFAMVMPHVVRGLRMREGLGGAAALRSGIGEVLDRMGDAVLLAAADGRIVDANSRALRMLSAGDGLSDEGGRLHVADPSARSGVERAVAVTAASSVLSLPPSPTVLPVPRRSGLRPYEVLVLPLPARREWGLPGSGCALVMMRDPEEVPLPSAERLARLHGFTGAEAQLAVSLAEGLTLKEHAEAATVTENTARWTLKQAMAKADVRSQSELVRVVLTAPATTHRSVPFA